MTQVLPNKNQEEWLKVLGKGLVTLPKKWRDEMGIQNGDVVKAIKTGNKVVIEATQAKTRAPYRIYSATEIEEFLKDDNLSDDLGQKVKAKLSSYNKS